MIHRLGQIREMEARGTYGAAASSRASLAKDALRAIADQTEEAETKALATLALKAWSGVEGAH